MAQGEGCKREPERQSGVRLGMEDMGVVLNTVLWSGWWLLAWGTRSLRLLVRVQWGWGWRGH